MDVYVDGLQLSPTAIVDECCEKLLPLVPLMRNLNKHRKCPRWSWVGSSNCYGPYDYCNMLRAALKNGLVPAARCRDINELIRTLSTGFTLSKKAGNALDRASCAAALAYRIGMPSSEVVQGCSNDREAIQISELRQLEDAAVCRVLFCNHPDVPEYQEKPGYEVAEYTKHSTYPQDFDRSADLLIQGTQRSAAQFLPKYQYGTSGYRCLICEVMLCGMKNGRYSENRLDGFNCHYSEEVGASEGRMTTGVYLDFHSGAVHIYPKEPGAF